MLFIYSKRGCRMYIYIYIYIYIYKSGAEHLTYLVKFSIVRSLKTIFCTCEEKLKVIECGVTGLFISACNKLINHNPFSILSC